MDDSSYLDEEAYKWLTCIEERGEGHLGGMWTLLPLASERKLGFLLERERKKLLLLHKRERERENLIVRLLEGPPFLTFVDF